MANAALRIDTVPAPTPSQGATVKKAPLAPYPIVIVGHVDHGKSTLIGRLLHDTDSLPEGRLAELKKVSEQRGLHMEWSFLLDALQIERDQGITLDTTRIWFKTAKRPYVIIDAPGHREFLRNMVTGAAAADAAVLVTDAERGISEQTRRHAYLLSLLGVRKVIVAVNKMDLVDHAEDAWKGVAGDVSEYLQKLGIEPLYVIPLSARHGDNIAARSDKMGWYRGPTLLEALDLLTPTAARTEALLRLPIQDVYRKGDTRLAVGRIETGRLKVGDKVEIAPTGQPATVASIDAGKGSVSEARAGQSVAVSFIEDAALNRGQIIAPAGHMPHIATTIRVRAFWLDPESLTAGSRITLRLTTSEHPVVVEKFERLVDVENLSDSEGSELGQGGIAEIVLRSSAPIAFDHAADLPITGRAGLARGGRIVGGCILLGAASNVTVAGPVTAVNSSVDRDAFEARNGHRGGVVWLTGLSGAGKSTLSMGTQRRLFDDGWRVAVLDGDNLRKGLNKDLGFTPAERLENVRRVAEVAKLMAETGTVVLVSLISPTTELRDLARSIIGDGFHEVWVKADVATCAARDPKGLYAAAQAGKIQQFTGVSAPFETPVNPELVLDTSEMDITTGTELLIAHIRRHLALSQADGHAVGI
ncbi:adenylyl-sulfate kinase [Niveispirillum cyanobacteriorum]|uniref:Adenylyl-sulfate kinase n=1 Tax=Niveispirillum cyanobacteriorum TaxID=1612173 RepID=A0A2K9NKE2_9PROT|nr:adenylyl-sulfate kinase [Niveispirillum cyanobacteriorum]AUN33549.1 adenylyl-sulfate kinase [Niveispirillum cyanobacteriorum]GGE47605.1 adenylyl-sulfate kinase [Niveispirillum cyanobacteriorum]